MRASRRSTRRRRRRRRACCWFSPALTSGTISSAGSRAMMPEDLGAPKGHRIFQQLLQSDKARFVGDRIAYVVAETPAQARDAADMVEVDYEPLPAVALLEDAAKDG